MIHRTDFSLISLKNAPFLKKKQWIFLCIELPREFEKKLTYGKFDLYEKKIAMYIKATVLLII